MSVPVSLPEEGGLGAVELAEHRLGRRVQGARFDGGNRSQQERMMCFERHRLKIEWLASRKYDAGERSPIVMSFDLRVGFKTCAALAILRESRTMNA